jgi:hypothetical protein
LDRVDLLLLEQRVLENAPVKAGAGDCNVPPKNVHVEPEGLLHVIDRHADVLHPLKEATEALRGRGLN